MVPELRTRPPTHTSVGRRLLLWVDEAGTILRAGPRVADTVGVEPHSLVGRPLSIVLCEGVELLRHLEAGIGPYTRTMSAVWSSASLRLAGGTSGRTLVGLRRDGESGGRIRIEIRRLE